MDIKQSYDINFKDGNYNLGLKVNHFKEGNYHILYIPFLNVSAYGDTVEEAEEMLDECLQQYYKDMNATIS